MIYKTGYNPAPGAAVVALEGPRRQLSVFDTSVSPQRYNEQNPYSSNTVTRTNADLDVVTALHLNTAD